MVALAGPPPATWIFHRLTFFVVFSLSFSISQLKPLASSGTGHKTPVHGSNSITRKEKRKSAMKKVALLVCLLLPVLSASARTSSPRVLKSMALQSAPGCMDPETCVDHDGRLPAAQAIKNDQPIFGDKLRPSLAVTSWLGKGKPPVPRPPDTPIVRGLRPESPHTKDHGGTTPWLQAVAKPPVPRPGEPPAITRFRPEIEEEAAVKPPFPGKRKPPLPRPPGTPIIRDFRPELEDEGTLMEWLQAKAKPPGPKQNQPPTIRD